MMTCRGHFVVIRKFYCWKNKKNSFLKNSLYQCISPNGCLLQVGLLFSCPCSSKFSGISGIPHFG